MQGSNPSSRLIALHVFAHKGFDGCGVVALSCIGKHCKLGLQNIPRHKGFMRLHDAGVLCGLRVIADQQLFVELLTGTQARDRDFYISIRIFASRTVRPDN